MGMIGGETKKSTNAKMRKKDQIWDATSVWHKDWQQRMERQKYLRSGTQCKTTMGLRQACSGCYVRAGHTLYDRRDCLSSSADKNANQVCYIICMNDFPMSLCLFHCRGQSRASTLGSSESLTADYFQATAFCCLT